MRWGEHIYCGCTDKIDIQPIFKMCSVKQVLGVTVQMNISLFTSVLRLSFTLFRNAKCKPILLFMIDRPLLWHSFTGRKSLDTILHDSMQTFHPKLYYPQKWALKSLTKRLHKCVWAALFFFFFFFVRLCRCVIWFRCGKSSFHHVHIYHNGHFIAWVQLISSRWGRKSASSATVKRENSSRGNIRFSFFSRLRNKSDTRKPHTKMKNRR